MRQFTDPNCRNVPKIRELSQHQAASLTERAFPPMFESCGDGNIGGKARSEEHTSELQSLTNLVCRLLLEKKKNTPSLHRPRTIGEDAREMLPVPTGEPRSAKPATAVGEETRPHNDSALDEATVLVSLTLT